MSSLFPHAKLISDLVGFMTSLAGADANVLVRVARQGHNVARIAGVRTALHRQGRQAGRMAAMSRSFLRMIMGSEPIINS